MNVPASRIRALVGLAVLVVAATQPVASQPIVPTTDPLRCSMPIQLPAAGNGSTAAISVHESRSTGEHTVFYNEMRPNGMFIVAHKQGLDRIWGTADDRHVMPPFYGGTLSVTDINVVVEGRNLIIQRFNASNLQSTILHFDLGQDEEIGTGDDGVLRTLYTTGDVTGLDMRESVLAHDSRSVSGVLEQSVCDLDIPAGSPGACTQNDRRVLLPDSIPNYLPTPTRASRLRLGSQGVGFAVGLTANTAGGIQSFAFAARAASAISWAQPGDTLVALLYGNVALAKRRVPQGGDTLVVTALEGGSSPTSIGHAGRLVALGHTPSARLGGFYPLIVQESSSSSAGGSGLRYERLLDSFVREVPALPGVFIRGMRDHTIGVEGDSVAFIGIRSAPPTITALPFVTSCR